MAEIIVALDVPTGDEALRLVDRLGSELEFVKVGSELFTREGPAIVRRLRTRGLRIFLDLKWHDIPNTVAAAVRAAGELEVELATLHASGGRAMMEAAVSARSEPLKLLAVTVLTSLDEGSLSEAWGRRAAQPGDEVLRLAGLAEAAGIDGVVSSPVEAARLRRRLSPDRLIVTPGIRPAGSPADDQRRIATAADAVRAGASHLVVGRAVTRAGDPGVALRALREDAAGALAEVR